MDKFLYYETEVGKPLYLNYKNGELSVSTERNDYTNLLPMYIADWTRFGNAYMAYNEWIHGKNNNMNRAIENYKENIGEDNGIDEDNQFSYNSINILLNQNGGKFPELIFGDNVPMKDVVCEVIVTYNALKLKGILGNDSSYTKFFKLAVEFELNAKKINPFPTDIKVTSKNHY